LAVDGMATKQESELVLIYGLIPRKDHQYQHLLGYQIVEQSPFIEEYFHKDYLNSLTGHLDCLMEQVDDVHWVMSSFRMNPNRLSQNLLHLEMLPNLTILLQTH